jgi:hypothetical protein
MKHLSHLLYSLFEKRLPIDTCILVSDHLIMEIYYLPDDVKKIILEYVPYKEKYILNKSYYDIYHEQIVFSPYDGYIRNIVRHDWDFIFTYVLEYNVKIWRKRNTYVFKRVKCDSYISLLNTWCLHYKANRCRNILQKTIND